MADNKERIYPIPEFQSQEEEEEYWQSHSPLMEGYEGKVRRKTQKRISFLSIRLTGDELAKLRELAARYGSGPSTYARQLLIQGMESSGSYFLPPPFIVTLATLVSQKADRLENEDLTKQITEMCDSYNESQEAMTQALLKLLTVNEDPEITKIYGTKRNMLPRINR